MYWQFIGFLLSLQQLDTVISLVQRKGNIWLQSCFSLLASLFSQWFHSLSSKFFRTTSISPFSLVKSLANTSRGYPNLRRQMKGKAFSRISSRRYANDLRMHSFSISTWSSKKFRFTKTCHANFKDKLLMQCSAASSQNSAFSSVKWNMGLWVKWLSIFLLEVTHQVSMS